MREIDINCDMGESFGAYTIGDDAGMLESISSANIACGFHGGDPLVMHEVMALAREKGVGVGAHPSFFDVWGFGRRAIIGEKPADIAKSMIYQIGAAQAMAAFVGHRLGHVKLHGALANQAFGDADISDAVASAVHAVDPTLLLVVMPGSCMETSAEKIGLSIAREIYIDRAYGDDGNLLPRKQAGALITDPHAAAARALSIIETRAFSSASGRAFTLKGVDTLCVHGDTPGAAEMARELRRRLEAENFAISPLGKHAGNLAG
jgi:UPF0271 protein